jgi:hypothetical protein
MGFNWSYTKSVCMRFRPETLGGYQKTSLAGSYKCAKNKQKYKRKPKGQSKCDRTVIKQRQMETLACPLGFDPRQAGRSKYPYCKRKKLP